MAQNPQIKALATQFEEAKTEKTDPVNRFRMCNEMSNKISPIVKDAATYRNFTDSALRKIREDQVFINRHRKNVRDLMTMLERAYRNPTKAFRLLEVLVRHYRTEQVHRAVKNSPFELGSLHGFDFFFIMTPARRQALENMEKYVLPALKPVLEKHLQVLRLEEINWEEQQAKAEKTYWNALRAFLDAENLRIEIDSMQLQAVGDMDLEARERLSKVENRNVSVMLAKRSEIRKKLAEASKVARKIQNDLNGDGIDDGTHADELAAETV